MPLAPPLPGQEVKVLHLGRARHTKGRGPIDWRFQGRIRHPKALPPSVHWTYLSPWHLNLVCGGGQGPRVLAVSAAAPPVKPTRYRLPLPTSMSPPMRQHKHRSKPPRPQHPSSTPTP
jgi:hypothetical protein